MMDAGNKPTLLFVYNADSGLFNALADSVHKLLSPSTYDCQLCALTYGCLTMRKEWADYLTTLALPVKFLHRNNFKTTHPNVKVDLPAIFLAQEGQMNLIVDAATLNGMRSLTELKKALSSALSTSVDS